MCTEHDNINKRFDALEHLLVKHADRPSVSLSELLMDIKKEIKEGHVENAEKIDKLDKKLEPIAQLYSHMTWVGKAGMILAGAVISIYGAWQAIKTFIHH